MAASLQTRLRGQGFLARITQFVSDNFDYIARPTGAVILFVILQNLIFLCAAYGFLNSEFVRYLYGPMTFFTYALSAAAFFFVAYASSMSATRSKEVVGVFSSIISALIFLVGATLVQLASALVACRFWDNGMQSAYCIDYLYSIPTAFGANATVAFGIAILAGLSSALVIALVKDKRLGGDSREPSRRAR